MCRHILLANPCGCWGPIYADPTEVCPFVMQQINRINDPEAWEGGADGQLPFELPEACRPGWHNVVIVASGVPCSDLSACPATTNPRSAVNLGS